MKARVFKINSKTIRVRLLLYWTIVNKNKWSSSRSNNNWRLREMENSWLIQVEAVRITYSHTLIRTILLTIKRNNINTVIKQQHFNSRRISLISLYKNSKWWGDNLNSSFYHQSRKQVPHCRHFQEKALTNNSSLIHNIMVAPIWERAHKTHYRYLTTTFKKENSTR